jgi:putative phage-type endonuclease
MKIINVEQGSPEWLAWRKTVITATEACILLGNNPWKDTPYKCWQRKLGLLEEKKSNDAMERGKRLEPFIRERFIKKQGINMTPTVVESSEYSFLGASLDGLSDCGKYIQEIKTGKESLYQAALEGIIPMYYMNQVQQQLLVTGAEKCFYTVGSEDVEKDVTIEVYPDPDFEKAFIPEARAFWKCVAFSEPPALQDADYKDMSGESNWNFHSSEYRKVDEMIKELEKVKETHRKELIKICGDQSSLGNGVKVMKTNVRGRVDYEAIPELKVIDIDKYRKASTTTWKILVA